jgi:hypothetical protein
MNGTEKRRAKRFPMRIPVAVAGDQHKSDQVVETRDVSSGGIYFEFGDPLELGSPVEFLLTMPEPITKGSPVRIRCMGKIVRIEKVQPDDEAQTGVAATIERYEFVRDT